MTTTPTDPPDRKARQEEFRRLLAEDSPEGEFLRELQDVVREVLPMEPPCTDCQEEEAQAEGDSPKDD